MNLPITLTAHCLPLLVQASTGGSGGRLVHASARPDAGSSSSASSSTVTVATPAPAASPSPSTSVAPASDIQTRQLRLLPWQTSASAAAPSAATADGSCSAAAASNSRAQQQPGADPAAPVCTACGGKHFLVSSRGTHPCHVCQQWRQAPEYRPGVALLTLQDVDLSLLDGGSDSGSDGEALAAGSGSDGDGGSAAASSSGSSSGSGSGRRGRRAAGPMTAERKQAISRALQSKGAKSEEHKR